MRGINNEDISYFVRKVAFKLHDTYENPNRGEVVVPRLVCCRLEAASVTDPGLSVFLVVEKPPFEVSETGWGEFDIIIKIHFNPSSGEKPLTLYHHLRLHPYEEDGLANPWPKQKPVTSYSYDEIVCCFNEMLLRIQATSRPCLLMTNIPSTCLLD